MAVEPLLEVHVFDFSGWLYNRELEVEFVAKIRDEEKFDSLDTLVQHMRQRCARRRASFSYIVRRNETQWRTTNTPSTFPRPAFR